MKRIATAFFALVALTAAGVGGYWAGLRGYAAPSLDIVHRELGRRNGPLRPKRTGR